MSAIWRLINWFNHIDWTAESLTAAATIILAVFTIILAFGTVALWFATRRLVRGAEDTSRRQLRAYIGVHQLGFMGLEDDAQIGVGFSFVNYGQTPAMRFNLKGAVDLLPYPLPEDFTLPTAPDRGKQDAIIFPNEANPLTGWVWKGEDTPISREVKASILSRQTNVEIYAHGVATYIDIFNILRRTEFCFFLNPASVVRDQKGNIVRNDKGGLQFQWAPVAGRNNIS